MTLRVGASLLLVSLMILQKSIYNDFVDVISFVISYMSLESQEKLFILIV